jgi:dTDP-4-dehydrorhamnose 3,5-epimerase
MIRLSARDTPLAGLKIIERPSVADHRGALSRIFCQQDMEAAGWNRTVAQVNHSSSIQRGTVRGMHFQYPPFSETKLVACLSGEIWDVAVDLRRGSPTFLRWHAEVLSAANLRAMLIPPGFAHGFQTLAADCHLIYLHDVPYMPEAEGALNPRDSRVAIDWPLEFAQISQRDQNHAGLPADFEGLDV